MMFEIESTYYDVEQVWVADNGGPTGVGTSGAKAASCAANK